MHLSMEGASDFGEDCGLVTKSSGCPSIGDRSVLIIIRSLGVTEDVEKCGRAME